MKLRTVIVMSVLVAAVVALFVYAMVPVEQNETPPETITLQKGWNTVVVPNSWGSNVTAKQLCAANTEITTVSYMSAAGYYVSYLTVIPNTNNFFLVPGQQLWILSSANTTAEI
jgi:hypothetical protein